MKAKIYLIDNYPKYYFSERIDRLKWIISSWFPELKSEIVHYSNLNVENIKDSMGFILSGSNLNVSEFSFNVALRNQFQEEINLITSLKNTPLLGICFGHHLISYAFNIKVERMSNLSNNFGIIQISLKMKDELINFKNIFVDVHHRDYISPNDPLLEKNFEILSLARRNGHVIVQYMKHLNRPIYSVQFHPETHFTTCAYDKSKNKRFSQCAKNIGESIIRNFIKICLNANNSKNKI